VSPQAAYAANKALDSEYELDNKRIKTPRIRARMGLPPLKKAEDMTGYTPHPESFLRRKVEKLRDPLKFDDDQLAVRGRPSGPSSRNRSQLRRTKGETNPTAEASGEAQSVKGSGDWIPMTSGEAEYWEQQLEMLQDRSGESAEREEREMEQASSESRNASLAEQNPREVLALRARGREQRGLPELAAEEVSVGDVMRSQGQPGDAPEPAHSGQFDSRLGHYRVQSVRRRLERSESAGLEPKSGSGSSSVDEELTEDENRGAEIVDAFMRNAGWALEGDGGFEAGELEEALRRSLLDANFGGEEDGKFGTEHLVDDCVER
jgi:hypothetical protein